MILLIQELPALPTNLTGPAWLMSVAGALTLISHFIIKPFFQFFYNDFLRDYWKRRLSIINDNAEAILGYKGSLYIIEGAYHILGRQLVSATYAVAHRFVDHSISEAQMLLELKTSMTSAFRETVSALSEYKSKHTMLRLSEHLESLTETDKLEFYAPIIAAILDNANTDSAKVRSIVLEQIDRMIGQASKRLIPIKHVRTTELPAAQHTA